MKFDILTIFPSIFDSYFDESVIKRARGKNLVDIKVHNVRDFAEDKHRTTDDKPYGGGAGMVMKAEPVLRAVSSLKVKSQKSKAKIIVLSAKGKQFNQKFAHNWTRKYDRLILISGRYEGIDERVRVALKADEISIGPYVLTDGDVAAMVIVSAVSRLLPGVIKLDSLAEESHSLAHSKWHMADSKKTIRHKPLAISQLEYPHYTRPEVLVWRGKKYRVPKVLLSGDHKKIKEWRKLHEK